MGLDVEMHIKGITYEEVETLNERLTWLNIAESNVWLGDCYNNNFTWNPDGTADFNSMWRYWGPGYERGPWEKISAVMLAVLIGFPKTQLWYGSDCDDTLTLITMQGKFYEYWLHALSDNGNDYRNPY